MWNSRDIIKTTVSIGAIYRCRNTPIMISVLVFMLINIGFAFPFIVGVVRLDQIDVTNYIPIEAVEANEGDISTDYMYSLKIHEGTLSGELPEDINQFVLDNYVIVIDLEDRLSGETTDQSSTIEQSNRPFTARLTKDYIEINIGVKIIANYINFEQVDFSDLTKAQILNYFLVNTLRSSYNQWVIPLFMFFYLVFLLMNTVFVGGMSLLAMLFRVADRVKLNYKQTLNLVIYSSVIPIVIAVFTSVFLNMLGINLLVYNFGTFLVYMIVRKQFLKNPKLPIGEV